MYSTIIYTSIFKKDEVSQEIAHNYASGAQGEIGLDWIARHSYSIASLLAYLAVHVGNEAACDVLTESMQEYIDSSFFVIETEEFIEPGSMNVETVRALNTILNEDLYSEGYFIGKLRDAITHSQPTMETSHLLSMDVL